MKTTTWLAGIMICLLFCLPYQSEAQFFKDVLDKTIDKTAEKVSEAASDEVSDEAEDKTREGIGGVFGKKKSKSSSSDSDSASDSAADDAGSDSDDVDPYEGNQSDYDSDTEEAGDPADYRTGDQENSDAEEDFAAMFGNFDRSDDVPDSYSFDYSIDIEIQENDEEPVPMTMFFNTKDGTFGMRYAQKKNETATFVYDPAEDIMVVYMEDGEEKTATAMPNLAQVAGQFGGMNQKVEDELGNFNFGPTGNTKTIAGVKAKEYKGGDDDMDGTFYVAKLPVDFNESFKTMLGNTPAGAYGTQFNGMDGMMLESHMVEKDKKKPDTFHWVTTRLGNDDLSIKKADYTWGMR